MIGYSTQSHYYCAQLTSIYLLLVMPSTSIDFVSHWFDPAVIPTQNLPHGRCVVVGDSQAMVGGKHTVVGGSLILLVGGSPAVVIGW